MFTILQIGKEEYKLRLRMRDIMLAEDMLGKALMDVLLSMDAKADGQINMLKTKDVFIILHASMQQMHHGITFNKLVDMLDETTLSLADLIPVVMEVILRDVAKEDVGKLKEVQATGIHTHPLPSQVL